MPRVCSKGMLVFSWRLAFRWPFFAKKNFKAENVMCIFNKGGVDVPKLLHRACALVVFFFFSFGWPTEKLPRKMLKKEPRKGWGGWHWHHQNVWRGCWKLWKNSLHCREWRNSIGCVGSYDAKPAEVSGCSCIHCSTMLEGCLFWDGIAKPWLL